MAIPYLRDKNKAGSFSPHMWIALWNVVKSKVYQGRTKPSLISSSWDFLISGDNYVFWPTKSHTRKSSSPYRRMVKGASNAASSMSETVREYIWTYVLNSAYFSFFPDKLMIYNLTRSDGFSLNVRSCWLSKDVQLVYLGTSLEFFHLLYEWHVLELSPASSSHHQDDFILNSESLWTFLCDCYLVGGRLKVCVLSGETSNISCFFPFCWGNDPIWLLEAANYCSFLVGGIEWF